MIKCVAGNIFRSKADVLVNPVNCVGVSGAGLALQFKQAYPQNQKIYESVCRDDVMRLGVILPVRIDSLHSPLYIVNLPTKYHWRDNSSLDDVARGVDGLVYFVEQVAEYAEKGEGYRPIDHVAVPALGCGYGGLEWVDVWNMLKDKLDKNPDVEYTVYQPRELNTPRGLWG